MEFEEDLELLKEFIRDVYHWLGVSYIGDKYNADVSIRWPIIPVDPRFYEISQPAWEEFQKNFSLEKIQEILFDDRFYEDDFDFDEHLKSHGLHGAQLVYKLKLVDYAAKNIVSGFAGWKQKLINLIDNLLNSLDPTGVAGALKEMKDALTASIP